MRRTWSSTRTRADPLGDLVQTLDVGMWHVTERVDWLAAVCVFGAALREEDKKPKLLEAEPEGLVGEVAYEEGRYVRRDTRKGPSGE